MRRHVRARVARSAIVASLLVGLACNDDVPTIRAEVPPAKPTLVSEADGYHVRPGESIQAAIEAAGRDPAQKVVKVHAGIYAPERPAQALIWLNAEHDGVVLEAVGDVLLTAANPALSDPASPSHPAIVNHVVYFGDGITRRTVFRGFRITGANGFVTREGPEIQPDLDDPRLTKKKGWFYTDGGGIKIFGRSYPIIVGVEVFDNFADPCGGGVSIEHRGFNSIFFDQDTGYDARSVVIRDSVFRNNRAQVTGSAIDLLFGSSAIIENSLFVGNVSNTGEAQPQDRGYNDEHGSGALTVFPGSHVFVYQSTFTGNWNGVDDKGQFNRYVDSIFWKNQSSGGISPAGRYELDIADGVGVRGCVVEGNIGDLRDTIDEQRNRFRAPDPDFDASYVPQAAGYEGLGYRPSGGS